ncbi:amino acid transporter [Roseibium aquae]|uniref:Amino acid transporter n=1 Tax=Roseibium aquae TaxID=1323746 RepID=A0A916TAX5_9HYPH|nr:LysE family transporter [Roseibium aquae]GGB38470.1 amino acid transporter [Roseibium aquae]
MLETINLPLIMAAALLAIASPGPATLAIAKTSMTAGRKNGFALAMGVSSGSLVWSVSAAMGLGAIMVANAWMLEVIKYQGAMYLLYLAYKSARAAIRPPDLAAAAVPVKGDMARAFRSGFVLHMTNPKAIFFFGSLYSIGVPPHTPVRELVILIIALWMQSLAVNILYSVLFSYPAMVRGYRRMYRLFSAGFSAAFGAASIKILTTRLG